MTRCPSLDTVRLIILQQYLVACYGKWIYTPSRLVYTYTYTVQFTLYTLVYSVHSSVLLAYYMQNDALFANKICTINSFSIEFIDLRFTGKSDAKNIFVYYQN